MGIETNSNRTEPVVTKNLPDKDPVV